MRYGVSIIVLLSAAVLEAGGQFRAPAAVPAGGGLVLSLNGYPVNALYVVFFFVVAQAINWIAFGQKPAPSLIFGGIMMVAGGLVVSLNR